VKTIFRLIYSPLPARVVWLFVLLNQFSYRHDYQGARGYFGKVVALAAFIPCFVGTGGNVGAQSSTVVIRGMNTDEIRG